MKYRAFLSYSHVDAKFARWLQRRLETYRPPRHLRSDGEPRGLGPVFRDREELASSASLSDSVNAALAESEKLIVICSPAAACSRWVNEEIRVFRRARGSDHVLCVIVDGGPGQVATAQCFPTALTEPDAAGFAPSEPLAADARAGADGRHDALLKIAAGLLGVGFDALKRRDLRRRNRRLVAIASASLALTAVTIVLAIDARIARDAAERRRVQAENLIDFMLGDLQEQLTRIGRLDVFESVGDEALEYFAAQRDDDSDYTLAQRARNLRQIGETRLEQGKLASALQAFEESLRITRKLVERSPESAQARIDLAHSIFYTGYVRWQQADLGAARSAFESVVAIVESVVADEPDNTEWLIEEAYANTNLGRVLELVGDLETALAAYGRVMRVSRRLMELEPHESRWRLELGFAHNNLGKLKRALGRMEEAEHHFRRDLEFKAEEYAADPGHNVRRSYLGVSQYYLGGLLASIGKDDEAHKHLTAARDHFVYLTRLDPERLRWRARLGRIERELGGIAARAGIATLAERHLTNAMEIFDALVNREEGNQQWGRDLASVHLLTADLAIVDAITGDPRVHVDEARKIVRRFGGIEPQDRELLRLAIHAAVTTAETQPGSATAQHALQQAHNGLDTHFAGSTDPRIQRLANRLEAIAARSPEVRKAQPRGN